MRQQPLEKSSYAGEGEQGLAPAERNEGIAEFLWVSEAQRRAALVLSCHLHCVRSWLKPHLGDACWKSSPQSTGPG